MKPFQHRGNVLGIFAQHRVAANLLMIIMILSGVWALSQLNTQFFPDFTLETIKVRVVWRGASAEDIEDGVTNRLEESLRTLEDLRKITSTSAEGVSSVTMEFESGADMSRALDKVKENVALIRDLPSEIEEPEITRPTQFDHVARVIVWGENDKKAMRRIVHQFERELLDRGIARIDIIGLQEQEIAIEIPAETLHSLSMSLDEIGKHLAGLSKDFPSGNISRESLSQQLRSPGQRKLVTDFETLTLTVPDGPVQLGDIAHIERRSRDREVSVIYQGRQAVEMQLMRTENADSLGSAEILKQWLEETEPHLPDGVYIKVYDERWQYIQQRINLLLENGFSGLILVVLILFLFLRGEIAFWVAVGIPVSYMATLAVLYLTGGSINMVSLFGLIMALGIIVDDAIVVGEDAMTHYQMGEPPLSAAEGGAWRMFAPVISSSLTTVSAFVPLMLLGGFIGKLLFAIPLVIICVIIASLVESFLVLPGHLRYTFERMHRIAGVGHSRRKLEEGFEYFREHFFRPLIQASIYSPWRTFSIVASITIITIGLLLSGRIPFTFLPSPESSLLTASIQFTAGTPRHVVRAQVDRMEKGLDEIDKQYPGLIMMYASQLGQGASAHAAGGRKGDHYAGMRIELSPSDERDVRNPEFIKMWKSLFKTPPEIESLVISSRRAGPTGRDIALQLTGQQPKVLKQAALKLSEALRAIPGIYGVEDDMPYGQEQLIFKLNAQAVSLGLTVQDIGQQVRAAYDGYLVQIFQDGDDEIEVRTILPEQQREGLANLEILPVVLPDGGSAPLGSLVTFHSERGFDILRHEDGRLAIEVSADVNEKLGNANQIINNLLENVMPDLAASHGIRYKAVGRAADQKETFSDMRSGSLYALVLIYLILAWVFASYGWPLLVMAIIPFAIIGAILGHWIMGLNLTILSFFGLFGLAGIVVNDSIILVIFYKHLRAEGMPFRDAIVEASVRRLRAVLLTSLTTIAGLIPLMFETSLQAQFLIPMAVSIAFGLAFSTLLVLLLVPMLLNGFEGRFAQKLD
ncbi:MAG: efflux RND transporter permease subunit [Gammaproteobacteria bacterium]|nr:MAG: efflux RND transporter permease subunit [Gammaproteobacteria bacterium]